ncbi:hypothetical protein [Nocardia sp. NBC_00403]|uniref:hypothetical protein n=1 Tax=Nocardia sp. NBC_00403 TaxID=2975990 RepID=UPI002E1EB4B9
MHVQRGRIDRRSGCVRGCWIDEVDTAEGYQADPFTVARIEVKGTTQGLPVYWQYSQSTMIVCDVLDPLGPRTSSCSPASTHGICRTHMSNFAVNGVLEGQTVHKPQVVVDVVLLAGHGVVLSRLPIVMRR